MRYEIVEEAEGWVVRSDDGRELARYPSQGAALQDVATRLRDADMASLSSVSVRYQPRTA